MAVRPLPPDVRRAIAAMEAEPGRAWGAATLADAAGVAVRTLQKHFRKHLGKPPGAALRDIRLARARRELLAGCGDVTEIAARNGFAHLGRFSGRYCARYGEAPMKTLRRRAPVQPHIFAPAGEGPTVALLPLSATPPVEREARAVADELAVAMARMRSVAVVSPGVARYQLHGSVREGGERLSVTLRLTEAATGRLLWAERWTGVADEPGGLEERVAQGLVQILQPCLRTVEIARAQSKDADQLTAYELTMRALPLAMALEPASDSAALELLERAMEAAPDNALPAALAAWCHAQRAGHHFSANPAGERSAALALAARARRLDRGDSLALTILSGAYTLAHDLEIADALIEKALLLDSGSSWAWARSAWIRCYRGESAEATERFQLALDMAPGDLMTFLCLVGIASACFRERRYDEAARWWRRSLVEHPDSIWVHRFLAPALAFSDRADEARRSIGALRAAFPDLTIEEVRAGLPLPREYMERVADGLESLGMPL